MKTNTELINSFLPKDIITFFGKTGVGKTTTINTLFKVNWKTDNAEACTKNLGLHIHKTPSDHRKLIIDIPGISESIEADQNYFALYIKAISNSGTIVWIIQGDSRVYRPDQIALINLKKYFIPNCRFFIAINQIDRIHGTWNDAQNSPSLEQNLYINEKRRDIFNKFSKYINELNSHNIICYSSLKKFNTNTLYRKII